MIQDKIKILKNTNIELMYKKASDLNTLTRGEIVLSTYEKRKFKKIKSEVESGDFVLLEDFLKN